MKPKTVEEMAEEYESNAEQSLSTSEGDYYSYKDIEKAFLAGHKAASERAEILVAFIEHIEDRLRWFMQDGDIEIVEALIQQEIPDALKDYRAKL